MSITIWKEPDSTTRTNEWYAQIAQHLERGKTTYVVPDAAHSQFYIERLLSFSQHMLWGDCILDLNQWLSHLANDRAPALSSLQRMLTLWQLLPTLNLQYYTHLADSLPGVQFLSDTYVRCISSGLTIDELHTLAEIYGTEREREFTAIAEALAHAFAQSGACDPRDLMNRALSAVEQGNAELPQTLIIDISVRPHPQLAALLAAISTHGTAVHVIAGYETPDEKITLTAREHCLTQLRTGATQRLVDRCELQDAAKPTTSISEYVSPLAEARHIAQTMRTKIEEGISPETLALLLHHPLHDALYHQAFSEYGLLHDTRPTLSAAQQPFTRDWWHCQSWEKTPAAQNLQSWLTWWQQSWNEGKPLATPAHPQNVYEARPWQEYANWQSVWHELQCQHTAQDITFTRRQFRELLWSQCPPAPTVSLQQATAVSVCHIGSPSAGNFTWLACPGASEAYIPAHRAWPMFTKVPADSQHPTIHKLRFAFPTRENAEAEFANHWRRWRSHTQHCHISFVSTNGQGGPQHIHSLFSGDTESVTPHTAGDLLQPDYPAKQDFQSTQAPAEKRARFDQQLRHQAASGKTLLIRNSEQRAHIRARYRDHCFSVTELETFNRCPYAFYARYLLGINVAPEQSPDPIPTTRGQWLHAILAWLYTHHIHSIHQGTANLDQLLLQAIETIQSDQSSQHAGHHPILTQMTLDELRTAVHDAIQLDCATWSQQEQPLLPAHCEWRFGHEQTVTLSHKNGHLTLRGCIDRIDICEHTGDAIVIDYKLGRGKNRSIRSKITQGLHLQIPLYIMVAKQLMPTRNVRGGLLFHFGDHTREHGMIQRAFGKSHYAISGRKSSSCTDEQWDNLLDTASEQALTAAQRIRTADIPLELHDCEYCEWLGTTRWENS